MLVEELKPFVDHPYRTLPGAENCGMGGSSLGGLVSLYLGLRYTWVFGKLARDVAVGVVAQSGDPEDGGADPPQARAAGSGSTSVRAKDARALPDVRALKRDLIKKGWKRGKDLAYTEGAGRRTLRMGMGPARRAHAEVPVSTARLSNADQSAACFAFVLLTYNRDRGRA